MKKLLCVVLLIMMLTGCSSEKEKNTKNLENELTKTTEKEISNKTSKQKEVEYKDITGIWVIYGAIVHDKFVTLEDLKTTLDENSYKQLLLKLDIDKTHIKIFLEDIEKSKIKYIKVDSSYNEWTDKLNETSFKYATMGNYEIIEYTQKDSNNSLIFRKEVTE